MLSTLHSFKYFNGRIFSAIAQAEFHHHPLLKNAACFSIGMHKSQFSLHRQLISDQLNHQKIDFKLIWFTTPTHNKTAVQFVTYILKLFISVLACASFGLWFNQGSIMPENHTNSVRSKEKSLALVNWQFNENWREWNPLLRGKKSPGPQST